MQFEYDPERLIEEIEKRPGLWNYMDVNYKSMARRVSLWNDIVAALLDPGVKLNAGEQRELVVQLQKKWKSLKDAYVKYVTNPNRSKRPYLYSRHLQFLDVNERRKNNTLLFSGQSCKKRKNGSDGNDSDSDYGPKKSKKRKKKNKQKDPVTVKVEDDTSEESEENQENDNDSNSGNYIEIPPISSDGNISSQVPILRNPEEFAFANTNADTSYKTPEADDSDKMFLLSLLPHLKSIPEEGRLPAKMKLLEVLQEANTRHAIV